MSEGLKGKEIVIEQELRDIYYNPKTGYQSAEKPYQKAKENGLNVSRKIVQDWSKTQDTFTQFKPVVKRHKFQKTFVKDLGDQIQMDLVDTKKYKNQNKGYYWILTAVEILSRMAFAIPVYRKNTENMTQAVEELLKQFEKRFGKYPNVAQFDEGKEFYNVGVKKLLNENGVEYSSTKTNRKAAIVERFNRTLKTSMWKYFHKEDNQRWINVLNEFVENYNNTKHRSILMKPVDVNNTNKDQVWMTLYGHPLGNLPLPKFKIGDTVRIYKYKNVFIKGYEANFTEEIFKIVKVFRGDPNMYEIEAFDGEKIIGKFYEQELSGVVRQDHKSLNGVGGDTKQKEEKEEEDDEDVYKVEKILKRKKVNGVNMVLVKWEDYDNRHNSWVPEANIHDMKYS